jgi:hypothetical protein
MLVANSVMMFAIGAARFEPVQLAIALAGMAVCLLWFIMTVAGWHYFYEFHNGISKIAGNSSFPFIGRRYVGDVIFICTGILILIFFTVHAIAAWQIWKA